MFSQGLFVFGLIICFFMDYWVVNGLSVFSMDYLFFHWLLFFHWFYCLSWSFFVHALSVCIWITGCFHGFYVFSWIIGFGVDYWFSWIISLVTDYLFFIIFFFFVDCWSLRGLLFFQGLFYVSWLICFCSWILFFFSWIIDFWPDDWFFHGLYCFS